MHEFMRQLSCTPIVGQSEQLSQPSLVGCLETLCDDNNRKNTLYLNAGTPTALATRGSNVTSCTPLCCSVLGQNVECS